jgi:hypothetical protein
MAYVDEDCNGMTDYDSQPDRYSSEGLHGDPSCPVQLTGMDLSNPYPLAGETITVWCATNPETIGVNSIQARIVDENPCPFITWSGSAAEFECLIADNPPRTKTAECFVNSSRSYQTGDNLTRTLSSIADSRITGYVRDPEGNPIQGAKVTFIGISVISQKKHTQQTSTDNLGRYTVDVVGEVQYDIAVSHERFERATRINQLLHMDTNYEYDFTLYPAYERCSHDCTYTDDEICHAECDQLGGCQFHDEIAKSLCDGNPAEWVVRYDNTHEFICCEGEPYTIKRLKVVAVNTTHVDNIARQIRFVIFRGKPVRFIVDVFK